MKIFIVSGPSGVGKSHLINELSQKGLYPLEVYTDRKRRPFEGEITDRVYLTHKEFTDSLADFLYWFEFQGNRYGYKTSDIETNRKKSKSVVFNIPLTFLQDVLDKLPEAVVIHLDVDTDNFNMLYARMVARDLSGDETEDDKNQKLSKIKKRLDFAKKEIEEISDLGFITKHDPLSKVFVVKDNSTLYDEVIPYILDVLWMD
ncbi:hypothetical protein JXA34_04265 [Patescibacteria group bacterium]|nr:hypothetical protein [Patescibacteria group bacterium]